MEKIIAVDFDGTLCTECFPCIGAAKYKVIKKLKRAQRKGAKIILWTCRCGEHLQDAVNWCFAHGIVFDAVNDNLQEHKQLFDNDSRKVFATEYWDDKAIKVR